MEFGRWLVVALLGATVAVGCGGDTRGDTRGDRPDAAAADAPVITVDDFGDTLRLAAPAQRVVSLNPVFTELVFALGYGDRLVGRTSWDLYPAAARAIPDLGDGMQPNVEAVLGARPDLVLLYASPTNRAAAQQLRAAGVPTLTLRTDHVADLARVAPIIGAAFGDRARGAFVADTVRASLDRVRAMPRPPAPRTVFWHIWESPLLTIGAGSYMSELVQIAGGQNVFSDMRSPSPQVSLEEVARRDPWAILAGPNSARTIRSAPEWQAVRAVREGRVLVADTTLVGRPGVRMGEAARHLRALIMGDTAR
ncbi:MAG TPA: helical backbone metal receptor [Gemmatimonadaceae bacterium]|nr:helical backbone metal receptor [Gemmatimonadaceae bacterium]